jgi:tape measure domain-containing protein
MADISLRIKSDFAQAEKDFKNLSDMSESARAKIEQFTQGFKTEQIDKFIEKNKMTAAGVTATSGKFAGMQREATGLQRQIQTLISKGLAPNDASVQKLSKEYDRLQKEIGETSTESKSAAVSVGTMTKSLISVQAVIGGIKALGRGIMSIVDSALMLEDAEASFTPLMGGANKARELVAALNKTAAETPFQFESISKAATQLLPVMNGDIEKTISTFRMLGDTAGGNAQKLESITRGFSKAMLKGKVDLDSLNMIADAGVPIFSEMADTVGFGKDNMTALFKAINTGKITTDDLTKTFQRMTGEGGLFFEGMIIASKTTSGVISTMKDNIQLTSAALGTAFLSYIKQGALAVIRFTGTIREYIGDGKKLQENIKTIGAVLAILVPAIIGYLAVTKGTILLTQAWTAAQTFLNAAMAANPIGLVVAGVIALGAAVALTLTKWDQFSTSIKVALSVIIGLFMGPFGLVAIHIIRNWEVVSAFFTGLFTGIRKEFDNFINYTSTLFSRYNPLSVVMRSFSGMRDFFAKIFGESGGFVEWFIKTVKFLFTSFTPLGLIIKNWQPLSGFFVSLWNGIKDTFQNGLQNIKSIIPDWMMRILQSGLANVKLTVTASKGVKDLQDRSAKGFNPITTQPDGTVPKMPGNKGKDPQEEALKQKLERMAVSEQAYNLQQTEDARNFYEKRADMEAVDGVNRLEWLMSQQEAIANMESLNREEKLTAERALTEAIIAEQKKLFDSRVAFAQQQLQTTGQMLSDLQTVFRNAGKESRKLAILMKGVAIAEASISTYAAFTKALDMSSRFLPFPANLIPAGLTLAAGVAKVAAIASTPIPTAQTGGTFTVPDMPAMRNDRAAVMASPGETVSVTPRGESGGMRETHVNIQIGESTLFRIIQTGIDTGKIVVSDRNIGRGVFA